MQEFKTYKFRAEAFVDIVRFFLAIDPSRVIEESISHEIQIGAIIVTFDTSYRLGQLDDILKDVLDAHVIRQTIAPEDHYTGIRTQTHI